MSARPCVPGEDCRASQEQRVGLQHFCFEQPDSSRNEAEDADTTLETRLY